MSQIWTDEQTGPVSYATGGFTITTTLTTVDLFDVQIKTAGANIGQYHAEYTLSGNQATIKIMRHNYDKLASITTVSGLPSGVTAQSTSGQTFDNESAHVHTMDHNHLSATAGTPQSGVGGVTLDLTAPISISTHTHPFDPPNFTGNTGAGSAHNHTWNNIYQHQHSVTNTATDTTSTELANGTDLSGTTFYYFAADA